MPYTNDMATLAQVVGPAYAAQQAGIENEAQNEQELAKGQVAQATVPQEIQKATLANQLLGAQGYAEQGLGMQNQAKGLADLYAAPSAAQAQVAGNQAKITSAHVGQLQQLGEIVGNLDQQMQGIPGPMRAAYMGRFLDSQNVTDPGIRQLAMNAASQEGGLTQLSQGLFQASNNARQAVLQENIRGGYQLGVAQTNVAGREAVAEANAQARVNVANINAQIRQQQQTFEQAAVAAQKRGDMQTYQQMSQLAMQMRQAQAQLNSQLLFGQGLPNPAVGGGEPTAPGAPQQPAQGGSPMDDALTAEMRKRGLLK